MIIPFPPPRRRFRGDGVARRDIWRRARRKTRRFIFNLDSSVGVGDDGATIDDDGRRDVFVNL